MADSDIMTDAHSIDEEDTTSELSREVDNVTIKRRSFSHDYYDNSGSPSQHVHLSDGDEVRATTSSVQLHPSCQEEQGDNHHSMQPTCVETSSSSLYQRQTYRQLAEPCSVSNARQRRRTPDDVPLTGADHDDEHAINNRERANTCPQHQFHRHCDLSFESDEPEAGNFSGEDEESGGEFRRPHGSDNNNERRTQSLPSSALLPPEYDAAAPSSSRRRAASASSIITPSYSPLHAREGTSTSSSSTTTTSPIVSSYTTTTLKHNLLKLLMLISIYQLLSYTYNTGLSPDVKYQIGEINYDIEEYWYGGRLWSGSSNNNYNRLSASRIVGSSGISFNDDYDGGIIGEEEGGEENDGRGVVNYFISLILGDNFGFEEEGGDVGIVDDEGEEELYHEDVSPVSNGGGGNANVSSSKVDSQMKSEDTTATPIIVANNNNNSNATKRRPAMAHAISISDAQRPVYLPRTSSSRRMQTTNDLHWSIPRIAGAIIWIGLMIPILEVGIRELSRRYRLGSLLRRRMRRWRGTVFRRGSMENVHSL